jgi:hypothetical protein
MINANSSPEAIRRSQNFWHGQVATSETRAATIAETRARIYADSPAPKTYTSTVRSKHLPRPGESDHQFILRTRQSGLENLTQHLAATPAVLEAVAAAYNAALERTGQVDAADIRRMSGDEYAAQRAQLGASHSRDHVGGGITGFDTPQARADALGGRFGGRQIQADGALANSVASVGAAPQLSSMSAHMIAREREAQARGQLPQRQDTSTLQSSGEGVFIR